MATHRQKKREKKQRKKVINTEKRFINERQQRLKETFALSTCLFIYRFHFIVWLFKTVSFAFKIQCVM